VIRCVRLWSDGTGRSRVEVGVISAELGRLSAAAVATSVAFEQSPAGASLDWHSAPRRQFVLTLVGDLEFVTRDGERFDLDPATVLLAEDTVGTGHRWTSRGDAGWQRVYVRLDDGPVPFAASPPSGD
jgi:hypothetical protein